MNILNQLDSWRPMGRVACSIVLGMTLLSGCATLTTGTMQIDVDVYKGPLTKTTAAQWEEIEAIVHQAKMSVGTLKENVRGISIRSREHPNDWIACAAPINKTTIEGELAFLQGKMREPLVSDDYQQAMADLNTLKIVCRLTDELDRSVQMLEAEMNAATRYDTLQQFINAYNAKVMNIKKTCEFDVTDPMKGVKGKQDTVCNRLSVMSSPSYQSTQRKPANFLQFAGQWTADVCNMKDLMIDVTQPIDGFQKQIDGIERAIKGWNQRFFLYNDEIKDFINKDEMGDVVNVLLADLRREVQALPVHFASVKNNVNFGNRFSYVRDKASQVAKSVDEATAQMLPSARMMDVQVKLQEVRKEIDGFWLDVGQSPLIQDYNQAAFDVSRSRDVSGVSKVSSLNNAITLLTNVSGHIQSLQEKLNQVAEKAVSARDADMKQWASEQMAVLKKIPYSSFVDLKKRTGEMKSQEASVLALEQLDTKWQDLSSEVKKIDDTKTAQIIQGVEDQLKAINDGILLDNIVKQDKTQALRTYKDAMVELAEFVKKTMDSRLEYEQKTAASMAATTAASAAAATAPLPDPATAAAATAAVNAGAVANSAKTALNQAITAMKKQSLAIDKVYPGIKSTITTAFTDFVDGLKTSRQQADLPKLQQAVQAMEQVITAKEQAKGEMIAGKSLPTGDSLDKAKEKAEELQSLLDDARMESLLKVSRVAAQMKLIAGNLTHIMIPYVSNDKFVRLAQVVSINSAGEYSNLLESRSKSLMEQLEKKTKSKKMPTSFYLDGSQATMFPNLYEWFETKAPGIYEDGRIKTYERVFSDYHWARLNTVYASGMGKTQMAFIRDEIGNWDLHSFSSDPTELMTAYKDATISGIQAAGKLMSGAQDASTLQKLTVGLGGLLAGPVPDQERITQIQNAHMETWDKLNVKNNELQNNLKGKTDDEKTALIKKALEEAKTLIAEKETKLPNY